MQNYKSGPGAGTLSAETVRETTSSEDEQPPKLSWAEVRASSSPLAVAALFIGFASLATAIVAICVALGIAASQDYESAAAAFQSGWLRSSCRVSIVLGAVALVIGVLGWRRSSTIISRREARSGAVFGVEGILIAAVILAVTNGDVVTLARNFLNFPMVRAMWPDFLVGVSNTLILTAFTAFFGVLAGLLISLTLISGSSVVRAPGRLFVNVMRGTPTLVLLSVIYFGFALGLGINWTPFVALIITLSLTTAAFSAEVFRAGLESLERGQLEASRGLGLSYSQSMLFVLFPQALRRVIPPLMNQFINLLKETSLIIFLGVTLASRDLFAVAQQGYSQYFNSSFFLASAAGYLIVTLPLIWLVNVVERKIRSGLVAVGG